MSIHTGNVSGKLGRTFLIVDSRRPAREALERLVRGEWLDSKIVGFDAADDALDFVGTEQVDVVIFNFDGCATLSAATVRSIRASRWGTRVLLLQFEGVVEEELELFCAGVGACVPKKATDASLLEVLRLVTTGGVYISAKVIACLARNGEEILSNSTAIRPSLSAREYTLLKSLKLGLSNKEIARSLQISESAVKLYLRNLFHKLRVRNRTEAVVAGMEMGIFESNITECSRTVRQIHSPAAEGAFPSEALGKRR